MKHMHRFLAILTLLTLNSLSLVFSQTDTLSIHTINDSLDNLRRGLYAHQQDLSHETQELLNMIPSRTRETPKETSPTNTTSTQKTDIRETLIISIPSDSATIPSTPSTSPSPLKDNSTSSSASTATTSSKPYYNRNEFGVPEYEPVFHRFFNRFKSQLPLKLGSEISITACSVPDSATVRFTLSYAENNTTVQKISPDIINTIFVYAMGEKAAATYLISYAYFTGRDIKLTCIGARTRQRKYATIENGFLEEIYHTFKDHADSLYRAPYRYYNNYDILTAKYLSILLFEPPRYFPPRTLPDGSVLNEIYLTDRNIVTNISYQNTSTNIDPVKIKNELLQDIPNNPDNYKIYILTHRGLYYSFTETLTGHKFNISIPYDQITSLSSSMSGLR